MTSALWSCHDDRETAAKSNPDLEKGTKIITIQLFRFVIMQSDFFDVSYFIGNKQ